MTIERFIEVYPFVRWNVGLDPFGVGMIVRFSYSYLEGSEEQLKIVDMRTESVQDVEIKNLDKLLKALSIKTK